MVEKLGSGPMIENFLERCVHALSHSDPLGGAAVVAGVRRRRLLGAEYERLDGSHVRQTVIPVHVAVY